MIETGFSEPHLKIHNSYEILKDSSKHSQCVTICKVYKCANYRKKLLLFTYDIYMKQLHLQRRNTKTMNNADQHTMFNLQ